MTLTAKDLFPIAHYEYGEAFFGSLAGMRFRVARDPLADVHTDAPEKRGEASLLVSVWPGPDSYRTAPAQAILSKNFPFTQAGLEAAAAWISEMSRG